MATNNKEYLYDRAALISEYEEFLKDNGLTASIESFTTFLKACKLQTTHADEIYKYITEKNVNLKVGDLQIRKSHPVWDYIRKKVLYPAAITGGLIGVTTGAIATSGLISGSNFMGFLPVFSQPALTFGATAAIGAGIGAAATVAFITGKDLAIRQYYKIKYKDAASNLQQLKDGIDLKNVSMVKLMEKIEATSQEIFTLGKHSPKRAFLNKINRNRIHHLEQIIVDLYPMWTKLDSYIAKAKREHDKTALDSFLKQKELVESLLLQADKFISTNIKEGKLNALLTCTQKRKHSHSTVENVDIFATICNKLDAVKKHTDEKGIKKMPNNSTLKKQTAQRLINGERRLIPELIERTAIKSEETEPVVVGPTPTKKPVKVKPTTKKKRTEPTTLVEPKKPVGKPTEPTIPVEPKKPAKPTPEPKTPAKKPAEPTLEPKAPVKKPLETKKAIRGRDSSTAETRRKKVEEMKSRESDEFISPTPTKTLDKPTPEPKAPAKKPSAPKTPAKKPVEPKTSAEPKTSTNNGDKVLVATAVLEKLNDPTFVSTQLNGTIALQYITSKNTAKTFIVEQSDIDALKEKLKEWLKAPDESKLRLYGKQDDLFKYIKFRTIRNMHTTVQSL